MKYLKSKRVTLFYYVTIVFTCIFPILQSCSSSDVPEIEIQSQSKYSSFLSISNITNRNSFSAHEKAIFEEAQRRIVDNLKGNDNGFLSLEHSTASELNMDESLFEIFAKLYKSAQVKERAFDNAKNLKTNTRMKTPSEINPLLPPLGIPTACEIAYVSISTQLNSIEQRYFDNYWTSSGDIHLTQNEVNDIAYASNRVILNSRQITIGDRHYMAVEVSYYQTQYKYALGTATVYYDLYGMCVGFKDSYDFNA